MHDNCFLKPFFLSILFLSVAFLFSEENFPVFSAELFYPFESSPDFYTPPDFDDGKSEVDENKKEIELLKEAVFVFSGMIYGFEFTYTPGDKRRSVEEVFEIKPIATIKWGDPLLKIKKSSLSDNKKRYFSVSYYAGKRDKSWLMYWASGNFPLIGGKGEGSFSEGFYAKTDAVENGIKNALRTYLKGRTRNKPQKVEGEFVFVKPPVLKYHAGVYFSSVTLRVNIEDISHYEFY